MVSPLLFGCCFSLPLSLLHILCGGAGPPIPFGCRFLVCSFIWWCCLLPPLGASPFVEFPCRCVFECFVEIQIITTTEEKAAPPKRCNQHPNQRRMGKQHRPHHHPRRMGQQHRPHHHPRREGARSTSKQHPVPSLSLPPSQRRKAEITPTKRRTGEISPSTKEESGKVKWCYHLVVLGGAALYVPSFGGAAFFLLRWAVLRSLVWCWVLFLGGAAFSSLLLGSAVLTPPSFGWCCLV